MQERILQFGNHEALALTLDARVVAIRWDVIPWSLVLDLDVPVSEDDRTLMQRAWLCFLGLSELTWPFANTRLPTGCWLTSSIEETSLPSGFSEFRFMALVPKFTDGGSVVENPAEDVIIRAQKLLGLVSSASQNSSEFGLTWKDRVALASDKELIEAAEMSEK